MPPPPPTPRALLRDILASLPASTTPSAATSSIAAANAPLPAAAKPLLLTLHVLFPTEFLLALDLLDRGLISRLRTQEDSYASPGSYTAPNSHVNVKGGKNGAVLGVPNTDPERGTNQPQVALVGSLATITTEKMTDEKMTDEGTEMLEDAASDQRPSSMNLGENDEGAARDLLYEDDDAYAWPIYHVRSAQQSRGSRYGVSVDTTTSYEVRLCAWNCSCPAFAFAAFPSGSTLNARSPPEEYEAGCRKWDGRAGLEHDEGWNFGGMSTGASTPPVCKHLLACVLVEHCELFKGYVQERVVNTEEAAGWAAGWGD